MTPDELTELEALERAATEGPLTVTYDGPSRPIIMNPQWEWLSFSRLEDGRWGSYSKEDADCYLYAALRNAAPRLFAALREAWTERDALRAEVTRREREHASLLELAQGETGALRAEVETQRGLLREARSLARLESSQAWRVMSARIDAALGPTGDEP